MSYEDYYKLVEIFQIEVDVKQSKNSTSGNGPISLAMIIVMGLRFMGGDNIDSVADIFGTDIRLVQTMIHIFLDAIDSSEHLSLSINVLSDTLNDQKSVACAWNNCSGAF